MTRPAVPRSRPRHALLLAVLLLAGVAHRAVSSPAGDEAAAPTATKLTVADLNWFAGSWRAMLGDTAFDETWMEPRGGKMAGMSCSAFSPDNVFIEFMQIEQRGDDIVFLVNLRRDEGWTEFRATAVTADSITFHNPANDMPDTIVYRKTETGLRATISGSPGGKAEMLEFHFEPR